MPSIEYFYSAHSAYAYLGGQKLAQICADYGCTLLHRPIYLSPVIEAAGSQPFAARTKAHADYFFGREIERWAEYRGVDMIDYRPTHHDNPLTLSNGLIIAAAEAGAPVDQLSYAILKAHWVKDADIADAATLAGLVTDLGLDADSLLTAALSAPIQALHEQYTQEAMTRSVFGSPTYVLDGDMFYGQDRLELLEHALSKRSA